MITGKLLSYYTMSLKPFNWLFTISPSHSVVQSGYGP